jgi:TolB-like protein
LLQNEAYSVSEVAYKSGFSSPSYFIARFHQQFGYSPGEVKKAGFKRDEVDKSPAAPSKQKAGGNVSRVFIYFSVAILFFTSLTFLAYSIFTGSDSSNIPNLSKSPDKSITLLPFLILGNSIDDQRFIQGLIDEIYIDLGKIGELRVIPKMSTEKYIKTSQSLFETAKKLNADYIISVSEQKYRDLFRFRIQLIDRLNDKQLWSKSFDVDTSNITDIFSLQSQMAQSIVTEVEEVITP